MTRSNLNPGLSDHSTASMFSSILHQLVVVMQVADRGNCSWAWRASGSKMTCIQVRLSRCRELYQINMFFFRRPSTLPVLLLLCLSLFILRSDLFLPTICFPFGARHISPSPLAKKRLSPVEFRIVLPSFLSSPDSIEGPPVPDTALTGVNCWLWADS